MKRKFLSEFMRNYNMVCYKHSSILHPKNKKNEVFALANEVDISD